MQKQVDAKDFPLKTFSERLLERLEEHDEENSLKFYQMNVESLLDLMGAQVSKRFPVIFANATKERFTVEDLDTAIKQLEHFANYVYFPWSKLNMIKSELSSEVKPIGV